MKNIYLATFFCLIAYLGGSSIATIMVLEESPDPVIRLILVTTVPCIFVVDEFILIIDYHGHMYSCNVCFRVK